MRDQYLEMINQHKGIIFKVTKIYTDSTEDQQDLYQEIVYQLWKSFASFQNRSKWSTWIYRVALNTALSFLNQKVKYSKHADFKEIMYQKEDIDDQVFEERIEKMYVIIKKLNEGERGLILLYLEGKKHDEIALITGYSISNVGTKLNRIKNKLKEYLNEK